MGIIVDAEPCDTCGYKTTHALLGGFSSRLCMRIATCNSCSQLVSLRVSHKNLPDYLKGLPEQTYRENIEIAWKLWNMPVDNYDRFDSCPNCGSRDVNFIVDSDIDCPKCHSGKIKLVGVGLWD